MADLERTYNVPLRKGVSKAPRYMRANKAIRVLRSFLERHMKSDTVKIGPYLNSKIVEKGRKNVPHHIEVKVIKSPEGIVKAEYVKAKNMDFLKPKVEEKKEEEIKLKIPGLGKKQPFLKKSVGGKKEEKKKPGEEKKIEKTEEEKGLSEKDKKEILEKPDKQSPKKIPEVITKDKELEVMTKEEKVYGREDKKPKVKEKK